MTNGIINIVLIPIEIWFYVSSYMEYGGMLDKPEVFVGTFWLIYPIDMIVIALLGRFFQGDYSSHFIFLLLAVQFVLFVPGYVFVYRIMKKNKRGLKILAKYHQKLKNKKQIFLIWCCYFFFLIPALFFAIIM